MSHSIRSLDPQGDLAAVAELYGAAGDYWALANRRAHGAAEVAAFFTDGPPGCEPAQSYRLGIFEGADLVGVAELSFGFPMPGDAYLGLMVLAASHRGGGLGKVLLKHVEGLARQRGAARIYLGVLVENPRGLAFWQGQGFVDTGVSRRDDETGHLMLRLGKDLRA